MLIQTHSFSDDDIVTVDEVAVLLKLKPKTIYAYVSARTIPFIKIGRAVRFQVSALQTWLETQKSDPIGFAG